ncbi:hypothetical protein C7H62_2431 [Mesoflavibacter sp. HG96]|nr:MULTISPECIES: hypothetical protein [unclassified Mesoflavibacter]QIJ90239.1 hypothetical protein C7H62_2431 [Mesoflavibacter sp. HG96]QIJ92967.1 hypothetical protein C7H56_2431 [Mesoflavibacter sp. HG37]
MKPDIIHRRLFLNTDSNSIQKRDFIKHNTIKNGLWYGIKKYAH